LFFPFFRKSKNRHFQRTYDIRFFFSSSRKENKTKNKTSKLHLFSGELSGQKEKEKNASQNS
jgi:hypothetical protein